MKLSWIKKIKIRLKHCTVTEQTRRHLRIKFDEIIEESMIEPKPLNKKRNNHDFIETLRIKSEKERHLD